jgi:Cu(I)/Ag(I) efflux system membrane fusion protein
MFANGILRSEIPNTSDLLIPSTSILWTGKRAVVYVKVSGRSNPTFAYREILLGPQAGNFFVVESGLEEGEEIAVNGVFKIDAAAQLAGKTSMMNPEGEKVSTGHNHGGMEDKVEGERQKEKVEQSEIPQARGKKEEVKSKTLEHAMLKVYGNCGMCESRIEKAAGALEGVITADWDQDTKMMHLEFDSEKVSVDQVELAIAAVGHDTENHRAPDAVYEDLPGCCLYDRPENN